MNELEYDDLAKEIILKAVPGSLSVLEELGLSDVSSITTDQLLSAVATTAGTSVSTGISFTLELLKNLIIKREINF